MASLTAKIAQTKPVLALAKVGAFLFGQPDLGIHSKKPGLDLAFVAAFTAVEIIECDQRSAVIAAYNSAIEPNATLADRVHVADRPTFLLALSQAVSTKKTLTVRMQYGCSRQFAETQISIQKHNDQLYLALQIAAAQAPHDVSRELAHELRTPLAAMVGLADALSQPHTCTEAMRQSYPTLIASAGRSLIELTGSILDANAEVQNVKLGVIAQECIALLKPMAAQKSIVLFNRLTAPLANQNVDGAALRQIITNLTSNAIKFSPAGASVEISASKSANGWTLNVTDNGNGIAPEDVARLGQKKFRGQSAAGVAGHGLGLSIVRRLVDEAYGRISFESRPGKGTQVEITFPASTLVEMSDFQLQAVNAPVSTPIFKIAAGAKHAAA